MDAFNLLQKEASELRSANIGLLQQVRVAIYALEKIKNETGTCKADNWIFEIANEALQKMKGEKDESQ